jgi:hypothetical protein
MRAFADGSFSFNQDDIAAFNRMKRREGSFADVAVKAGERGKAIRKRRNEARAKARADQKAAEERAFRELKNDLGGTAEIEEFFSNGGALTRRPKRPRKR